MSVISSTLSRKMGAAFACSVKTLTLSYFRKVIWGIGGPVGKTKEQPTLVGLVLLSE